MKKLIPKTIASCTMTAPMTSPGVSVMSVSSVSSEPISVATPPVIPSPTNIQRKTRCRNPDSSRATATGGWPAYSTA
jgi:hypothetical protein